MNDDDQGRENPGRMHAKVPGAAHHVSHYTLVDGQTDVGSCTSGKPSDPRMRDLERVRAARWRYGSTVPPIKARSKPALLVLVDCHGACRSHEASHFAYTYI
jgi:hypothetical protein